MRIVWCLALFAAAASLRAQTITTTASYNNIGVTLDFAVAPTQAVVRMFVKRAQTNDTYREVHPLSRISPTRFAGSVFWLDERTSYDLKLTSPLLPGDRVTNATTRWSGFVFMPGAIYHVATNGNDSNSGTSRAQAWRTVGRALSAADAGVQIVLYNGTYYEGELAVPRSGTPTAPIQIYAAAGNRAILSGVDTNFVPVWTLYHPTNFIYRTPCTSVPEFAYLNGAHLYHYDSLADLTNRVWNLPAGCHVNGTHLYARFPNNGGPSSNVVTIPRFSTGISIGGQTNIRISRIEFEHYGLLSGALSRGIDINGGDSNVIEGCTFRCTSYGVLLRRTADFNTIESCTFTEPPVASWGWNATKATRYESAGVAVIHNGQTNRGNVIRGSRFMNVFDGAALTSSAGPQTTEDMDMYNNLVQDCVDDGIEVNGNASNCRIYFNWIDRILSGISLSPCTVGPTYVFRNLITDWAAPDTTKANPIKLGTAPVGSIYVYHNTCVTDAPDQEGLFVLGAGNWAGLVFRNNIIACTSYAINNTGTSLGFDLDYDCLYTSATAPTLRWNSVRYDTLAQFAAATGLETNGVWGPPGFVNAAALDYYLRSNSPAIDKGVVLPGMNDGYVGQRPDMGLYEHGMQAQRISKGTDGVTIDWRVGALSQFQLQFATNLVQSAWTALGSPIPAERATIRSRDALPTNAQRFYRLQRVP
jgi:hypothetical protein